jgi:hypothetical protein
MKAFKFLALAGAVALVAALGVSSAQAGSGRQYYSGWQHSPRGCFFSTYFYKPSASSPTYCHNYAIWYPSAPNFVYYFNPYKGTYWGRFDVKTKGYSLLAEKDRAGQLKDIPEKAFPAEGPLPQVPDAKDKLTLAEPLDLPVGETPVVAAKAGKVEADAVAAAAVPAEDALATTPADDKTPLADPPADPKADKPAGPATPAGPTTAAAPAGAAGPAAPAGPDGKTPPADGPVVDAKPGVGVVPPTEPVSAAGGVAPVTGGTPAPVGGVVTGGTPTAVGGFATGSPVQVGPDGFRHYYPNCHRQHVCH